MVCRLRAADHHRLALPRDHALARQAPATLTRPPRGTGTAIATDDSRNERLVETIAVALGGGAVAAGFGGLFDVAGFTAVIGVASGAVAGYRRIYNWRHPLGWLAALLDFSWALITTAVALLAHAVAARQPHGGEYRTELSERDNRHVYGRGLVLRTGFLTTIGNVISGAGDSRRPSTAVDSHEHIHVWQTRWFGPIFPLVYVLWSLGGAIAAAVVTLRRRDGGFQRRFDDWGYYSNPFEWWAYSRQGRWPLPAVNALWERPMAAPRTRRRRR